MSSALSGRTILVTREEGPDGPLSRALRAHGAGVVNVPLLETRAPEDPEAIRREAHRLDSYDWVLLTSARAARALASAAGNGGPRRLAVVGSATARSAREAGWEPTVVGHAGGVELVEAMRDAGTRLSGARVLFPAADRVRPDGVRALEEAGAQVRVVTAYCTHSRPGAEPELRDALSAGVDAVTFASPSAAEAFAAAAPEAARRVPVAAAIGRTTADAVRPLGFATVVTAERPTFESLADALAESLSTGEA